MTDFEPGELQRLFLNGRGVWCCSIPGYWYAFQDDYLKIQVPQPI